MTAKVLKDYEYFSTKLGTLYCGDCNEILPLLDKESIDLVVTSPPYNLSIKYDNHDDIMDYNKYLDWQKEIFVKLKDILKNNGRVCWNIPFDIDNKKGGREPLYSDMISFKILNYRTTIYWDSGNLVSRTAWGSFASPSAPHILLPGESIIVFYKGEWNRGKGETDITNKEFVEYSLGKWSFNCEKNREHPAPFPIDLPYRCLKFFGYKNDITLDCYFGSGTTALACEKVNRKWCGIELSPAYCEMAKKRIELYTNQIKMF